MTALLADEALSALPEVREWVDEATVSDSCGVTAPVASRPRAALPADGAIRDQPDSPLAASIPSRRVPVRDAPRHLQPARRAYASAACLSLLALLQLLVSANGPSLAAALCAAATALVALEALRLFLVLSTPPLAEGSVGAHGSSADGDGIATKRATSLPDATRVSEIRAAVGPWPSEEIDS